MAKIRHLAIKKKVPSNMVSAIFWKIPQKIAIFLVKKFGVR